MAITFRVTYEVVTEESAENGDFADSGFYSTEGHEHEDATDWTLHDIVSKFGRNSLEDTGRWFATSDEDIDYRTGDRTSYSVHPPEHITRASYQRVARILDYRCNRRTR